MPRRVNLTILLSLIIVIVLSVGLSASARPDDGQGAEPGDDSTGGTGDDDAVSQARGELERLQKEVQAVHGERLNAVDEKERAADDIAATQTKLANAEEHRAKTERQLADTASEVYRNHGVGDLLGVLFGTEASGGFTGRLDLAVRLLTQKQGAVKEANQSEQKLTRELEERRNKLQEWESTDAEQQALEEQVRQAEADVQDYLDSLDEGVRQEIEADRARQAELDQARGQEILRKLTEEDPSVATPAQNLAPVQDGKLDELKNVERGAEENAAQKAAEAEQARIAAEQQSEPNLQKSSKGAEPGAGETRQAEPLGLVVEPAVTQAEQAATEAAKRAEAAEQARRVAEQDAAVNQAKPQASPQAELQSEEKKAGDHAALPAQVSNTGGVPEAGDKIRVEGSFSIKPGASVTFEDANGIRGTAIDGVNARLVEGSIDVTMTGPLENVTGGDGVLDTSGGLKLVDTTGIVDANLGAAPLAQDVIGTAGLQHDPLLGAVGDQHNPLIGTVGGQTNPLAGAAKSQPKPPAVSGQPGLQPASSAAPVVGSPSGKAIVAGAMGWLGAPYSYGGTSRGGISCSGLVVMVYGKFGISLPNSPEGLLGTVGSLKSGTAPPGAVVFFAEHGGGTPTHVGLSNGDGTMTDSNVVKGMVGITPIDIVPGYMGWGFPPGV